MKRDTVQYDDHGNFLLEGDVEAQWMKLHRDIQAEYRQEQLATFFKGTAWVAGLVAFGYLAITGFNLLMY